MGSHLTLGTPLTIEMLGGKEKETYEDLDEVVARYVEPYVANVKELVRHRKFREGLWQNIKVRGLYDFVVISIYFSLCFIYFLVWEALIFSSGMRYTGTASGREKAVCSASVLPGDNV